MHILTKHWQDDYLHLLLLRSMLVIMLSIVLFVNLRVKNRRDIGIGKKLLLIS